PSFLDAGRPFRKSSVPWRRARVLKDSAMVLAPHASSQDGAAEREDPSFDVTPWDLSSFSRWTGPVSGGTSVAFDSFAIFCHSLPGPIPWAWWLFGSDDVEACIPLRSGGGFVGRCPRASPCRDAGWRDAAGHPCSRRPPADARSAPPPPADGPRH